MNRLYAHAEEEGYRNESLVCINADTGEIDWKTDVFDYDDSSRNQSTPVVYDGYVYMIFNHGVLRKYDAFTGELDDTADFADDIVGELLIDFGGNKYYFEEDGTAAKTEGLFVYEWEYETGDSIAVNGLVYDAGYPIATTADGNVYGLDRFTGELDWEKELGDKVGPVPAIDDDARVMVVPTYDDHVHSDDISFVALDTLSDGDKLWEIELESGSAPLTPLCYKGDGYLTAEGNGLYKVDVRDGDVHWVLEEDNLGREVSPSGSPTIYGNEVFITAENGHIYSVDAETGSVNWSMDETSPGRKGAPTVGDGVLYSLSGAGLIAIDLDTQDVVWKYDAGEDGPSIYPRSGLTYLSDGAMASDGTRSRTKTRSYHRESLPVDIFTDTSITYTNSPIVQNSDLFLYVEVSNDNDSDEPVSATISLDVLDRSKTKSTGNIYPGGSEEVMFFIEDIDEKEDIEIVAEGEANGTSSTDTDIVEVVTEGGKRTLGLGSSKMSLG